MLGRIEQAQNGTGGVMQARVTEAPTLLRAITASEDLGKRLVQLRTRLLEIAEALGGPTALPGADPNKPPDAFALGRLNEAVSDAHNVMAQIESLVATISHHLG